MDIKAWDKATLIAQDGDQKLYIVKWGDITKYAIYGSEGFQGEYCCPQADDQHKETDYIRHAYSYALSWGFKPENIKVRLPNDRIVTLNQSQIEAIKLAAQGVDIQENVLKSIIEFNGI